jgi:hypothetical protein
MSDANEAKGRGDPGRTIHGPAISAYMFFEVFGATAGSTASGPVRTAKLRAHDRHEIWLESCDDQLRSLEGELAIFRAPHQAPSVTGHRGSLSRGSPYKLTLFLSEQELALAEARLMSSGGETILMVEFDVEYHQGWESPGGYSPAYGVRYWDDVAYPHVEIDRFELE